MNLDGKIKEAFARHETDVQPSPGAWTGVEKAIGRRHKARIALTLAGAVMAVTAAVVAIPRLDSNPKPFDSSPTATLRVKPAQPRLIGKVPARVSELAVGSNSLWGLEGAPIFASATPPRAATLVRIDPSVRKVMARISVGYVPQAVAADSNSVWVTNTEGCPGLSCAAPLPSSRFPYENSAIRIDPRTNKVVASISIHDPQDVAIGFGSVWVTAGSGGTKLLRIDPRTNRVIATIALGDAGVFSHVAIGRRSVFATVSPSSSGEDAPVDVAQVDPATNKSVIVKRVNSPYQVADIAAGWDSVWLTTDARSTPSALFRFDQSDNTNGSLVPLPDAAPLGLNAVTTGEGYVWAVSARGYLWKVDPATGKHDDPTTIGAHPPSPAWDVVTGFGFAWISSADGHIWQYAP